MAETTFTVDQTTVGTTIGPDDGWITSVEMLSPPTRYDNAAFRSDRRAWASGYFSLSDADDRKHMVRNLICVEQNNICKSFTSLSIGYRGGLLIRSVPFGSIWQIVVSDQLPIVIKAA